MQRQTFATDCGCLICTVEYNLRVLVDGHRAFIALTADWLVALYHINTYFQVLGLALSLLGLIYFGCYQVRGQIYRCDADSIDFSDYDCDTELLFGSGKNKCAMGHVLSIKVVDQS